MKTFDEVLEKAGSKSPITVAVAAAADREVLEAVSLALQKGIAKFLLIGDEREIGQLGEELNLPQTGVSVIHAENIPDACSRAVAAVNKREADVVMKGMVQTADFLRAILNKENGLRIGKQVLSHVAVFEVPGYDRLIHVTDAALNVAPSLPEKAQICQNVIRFCHSLENVEPRIGVLGAVEVVNPNMPPTLDAAALTQMNRRGQIKGAIVDGPFALDNAISVEAAKHKGIESPVAGQSDVLFVPDIEAGNILYKSLVYFANSKIGALVLGAKSPIVLTSRSDSSEAKLYSIALAVLQADNQKRP
ncbi:phosphate butyryltransferase [Hazenella sp. IB182357]|uniref:Phosphate butyryltransferase n=1 Tax=Polycladospora coralii TaxID=2771432 RepID=A0A926NCS0_9BACL|nr:phosphate butyryltransferase [Polycladospora coralii]MBS7530946.1 phosphate butyryltransferase [Polycladospora coralii]